MRIHRFVFFVELCRLTHVYPGRWSVTTVRAVAALADTLDYRELEDTLDAFEDIIGKLMARHLN